MRPVLLRGPELTLASAPAEWLPDYRDPTFSLSPLTHFVSDEAPAGLVSLTGRPYRGTSVLPEGSMMPEVELVPRRLPRTDAEVDGTEAGPDNGRVYFAIPKREPSPAAASAASSPAPRLVRRPAPLRRPIAARRPAMSRAPSAIVDPMPRPRASRAAPKAVEARSGEWHEAQWQDSGGAVSIPTWTQSLASRDVADLGRRSGVRSEAPDPMAAAPSSGPGEAPRIPPAVGGVYQSLVTRPENPARVVGDGTGAPGTQAPAIPAVSGLPRPAVNPPAGGSESEVGRRPSGAGETPSAAAPLRREEAAAERGLLGDREDPLTARQPAGTPQVHEEASQRAPESGAADPVPGGQSRELPSQAPGVPQASPRRAGLGEPIRDAAPHAATRGVPSQGVSPEVRQPGARDQAGAVVYTKNALGEMRVSGAAPAPRGAYPTVVPEPRAGREVSVDPLARPSRPLVGARTLGREPEAGTVELPGVGPVEVRQDAMADARLRNADALGSTTGGNIDIARSLGSPAGPQAIGVFAHELTHVYQQRALGGRPMPDPSSAEGKRMEAQAETVRRSVERSPAVLAAPGPTSPPALRTPGSVAPAAPGAALPPRALVVARIAAATVAAGPVGAGQAVSGRPRSALRSAGQAEQSGVVRPSMPQVISNGSSAARPAPQRIVSPVASIMAGAGAPAGGASTQHLDSGLASGTDDTITSNSAPGQSEMRIPEQEVNRLYREFLHRFKNQLRWESDRNGRINRFFKD